MLWLQLQPATHCDSLSLLFFQNADLYPSLCREAYIHPPNFGTASVPTSLEANLIPLYNHVFFASMIRCFRSFGGPYRMSVRTRNTRRRSSVSVFLSPFKFLSPWNREVLLPKGRINMLLGTALHRWSGRTNGTTAMTTDRYVRFASPLPRQF